MILPFLYTVLLAALPGGESADVRDAVPAMTDTLSEAVLVSSFKQVLALERLASPVTEISAAQMEERGVDDMKKLSAIVPNFQMPDYGSSMTSSIYLRGFGSRIDNPVIGLYVDDIPVMNKNAYDTGLYDIGSAVLLRGPQSTLYGRNSMCGVLALETLSPEDYHGGRVSLEYGSANTVLARLSVYGRSGVGASVAYRHKDGYYLNTFDNSYVDRSDDLNFRLRAWKQLRWDLVFENVSRYVDHLHTVAQRRMDIRNVIGRSDEQHLRKVIFRIEVVVVERRILLRIEYLQQGRRRIAVVADRNLVDLIENDDRIGRTRPFDRLYDPSGHSTDIGFTVSTDLSLVVQSS